MCDAATPELRVLARLGLKQLAIADQLVLLLKRFRATQLRDLEDALRELPAPVIAHIQAYFDRKLDVKDELERYVQDLLKTTHLTRHLQIEDDAQREILTLMGALGDGDDRALLLKMLQSLGAKLARVLSGFCVQLPHITLQQEVYRLFAATDSAMGELKKWMQWLDSVKPPKLEVVTEFLIKGSMERCLAQWLNLLSLVAPPMRVAVVERLKNASAPLLKQIGRFHEVTAVPVVKLLDLCDGFHAQLPMLLVEFPMATTLTLYAKFNDSCLIDNVVMALYLLGKGDVIRVVDTLATVDNLLAIRVFFVAMTNYERRHAIVSLYLTLSKLSQSRLVDLVLHAAGPSDDADETDADPSFVFGFLLDGHLKSIDDVLRKFSSMSKDKLAAVLKTMRLYNVDELMLLGEGIEVIIDLQCLDAFFRLFEILLPTQRSMLVDWVHDMPGDETVQLYNKFFELHRNSQLDTLASLLQMISSLRKSDKFVLCNRLLRCPSKGDESQITEQTNDNILKYLCGCDSARRHKTVKLLDATDRACYDTLLFLLRTQRMPEQVALTKVMLSLSPEANGRLLIKLQGLDGETLDEFFQLLMLIPKIEYKMLSRLLVSQEVSLQHFQEFVHVAANMMNQAATREMLIFAAELPPKYRNMFFEMLGQCSPAEKGVVMRIVASSTRMSSELLQIFVEILLRMPWETRSALVEQLRALEETMHIQTYVLVLREFDDDACLPRMVHLVGLLPLLVRISLVPLFAQMGSPIERVQALGKLNAMRKDQMPGYCSTLCDPACLHRISCNFLRVLGHLQDEYQAGMLKLLQWTSCWVFIEVLAVTMDPVSTASDSRDGTSANGALVNGLAASLTMLDKEDDYILLGDVMEEAMENGIPLEALIVVLAHFRDRDRLLMFLKYVADLTRSTRSTLFFRVLSRSQATAFLFDMCHVLDLDDTLFALKRLDRMCARDAIEVDKMLTAMARNGSAADLRDEFCNAVLGYRERAPVQRMSREPIIDRVVEPRTPSNAHQSTNCRHGSRQQPTEVESSITEELPADLSSVAPASFRPVVVVKQLDQVKDKREDARRRRRCRNWREWTIGDWDDMVSTPESACTKSISPDACNPAVPEQKSRPTPPPSSREWSENVVEVSDTFCTEVSFEMAATVEPCEPSSSDLSRVTLPPIVSSLPFDGSSRPDSGHNNRPTGASVLHDHESSTERGLTRSESVPVVLHQATVGRAQRYRGVHAALGLETVDAYHVQHDKGASIFHSQCEHVIAQGPSRIRVARSEKALARVLEARADHALGRRPNLAASLTPSKSSLQRSARCTIERAVLAIARSQETRSQSSSDFVRWERKGSR